ncbi:hypothetical protein TKK_0001925 [Trichogramma kaykai]|uniref:RAP domain-containing protein n=1 Tax=Trichogramma kaykai TaxID=54128 RepID=A0ABD2XA05_9HYME
MTMLKLSAKIVQPRPSWWVAASQYCFASSVAADTNPQLDAAATSKVRTDDNHLVEKIEKVTRIPFNQRDGRRKRIEERLFDTNSLRNMMKNASVEENRPANEQIIGQINQAQNIDDILSLTENPGFNQKTATTAVLVLSEWVSTGKIRMTQLHQDSRYKKLCSMVGINQRILPTLPKKDENIANNFSSLYGLLQTEKFKQQIRNLKIVEMIKVLSTLASKGKRNTPVLQTLAFSIATSQEPLNIKQLGDILYSMAVLNFYDEMLIKKVCINLLQEVPTSTNTAVVGSIFTSLGMLRYRDEKLLGVLTSWVIKNSESVRPQDVCRLLLTLAHVGYKPEKFDELVQKVVAPLTESDMCQSSEWLDVVWALTVLDATKVEHYESVLNKGFLNRIFGDEAELKSAKILKILNINAAARLITSGYKGPTIPTDSDILTTQVNRTKEKTELANAIVAALKILLPSDSAYLNTNINTKMGFLLDADFCVDSKCTPIALNTTSAKNKSFYRIALLTCAYQEFCRGTNSIVGLVQLYKKLLEAEGYTVMLIPYNEVNFKDKLVTRVKYINDNLKSLLNETPKE